MSRTNRVYALVILALVVLNAGVYLYRYGEVRFVTVLQRPMTFYYNPLNRAIADRSALWGGQKSVDVTDAFSSLQDRSEAETALRKAGWKCQSDKMNSRTVRCSAEMREEEICFLKIHLTLLFDGGERLVTSSADFHPCAGA